MMKCLDLFSGIGGFAYAAQQVWNKEYSNVGHSEIDKYACKIYHYHFPNSVCLGDIKKIEKIDCDLITGGFPCQDVSIAGKRKGLKGEQTGLFWELARIIETSKPKWILLENVLGLLSQNGGADMLQILRRLSEIGYCICWRVLNAQYFGVAQRRKRVWIVGSLGSTSAVQVLFEPKSGGGNDSPKREMRQRGLCISARDGRRQNPTSETLITSTIRSNNHDTAGNTKPNNIIGTITAKSYGDKGWPATNEWNTIVAQTIGATTRGNSSFVWQDPHIAEINPVGKREIDGISRGMDSAKGQCLGNAIVPACAFSIMQEIKRIEENDDSE